MSGTSSATVIYFAGSVNGTINGSFDTTTANFLTGDGTGNPTTFSAGVEVIFDDTAATGAVNVSSGGVSPLEVVLNNNSLPYTFSGGPITGTGGLSVNGTAGVTLASSNTFTGGTSISAGTLTIPTGGSLASNTITVGSAGTLTVSGGSLTSPTLTLNDSGTVNFGGTSLSLFGLNGSGTFNSTNSGGTSLTFTGGGSFSGALNLGLGGVTVNAGGSTLTLSGNNSYSSGTNLVGGTLLISSESAISNGPVNLSGGAIGSAAGNVNLSSLLTGGPLLVASGTNSLEISNSSNTFSGPVVVESGGLIVDNAGALGATTTIDVASGASLVDNSGNPLGAGSTMTLSGAGVGGNGALRGADGTTATWAGNINISGPSQISPGFSGTLILTGAITGNGPVSFAPNSNSSSSLSTIVLAPPAGTSNTYTGESQVYGGTAALVGFTVQLGNDNGFSSAAGLNFNGGSGLLTVDLSGYNQTVTYLTGAGPGSSTLTNSTGNLSTLTISNGNNASALPQAFSTPITGNIAVVKTGGGNQTLAAVNTYSGGTTVSGGTLTIPNSSGLGSGAVTLAGGTLALSSPSNVSGFGSLSPMGSASLNAGVVTLNPTNGSLGGIFTTSPVTINDKTGFTTSFVYNPLPMGSAYAQGGMAFNIQKAVTMTGSGPFGNGVPNTGGGGGWSGISIDFEIEWDITGPTGAEGTYTGLSIDGQASTAANTNLYDIDPFTGGQAPITVTLNYSNGTLTETLQAASHSNLFTGAATPTSITFTYSGIDIAEALGGASDGSASAYVGFTGVNNISAPGSNNYWEEQQISGFNFSGGSGNTPVSLLPNNNAVIAAAGTSSVLQIGASQGSNTEFIPSLTLNNGSSVALTTATGSTARAVLAITGALSVSQNSSGAFNAQLDVGSNDLDLSGGSNSLAAVTAMVAQGYANGRWNGQGIASSAAAADTTHLTAVGVILNDNGSGTPLYGSGGGIAATFDGSTPSDGDILVKYTYYGDANLDGTVDASDYSLIDNGYLNKLTGWYNGDFNYDGVVNGSDYTLIDNAYNMQGAANPSTEVATEFGSPTAVVPEPATLGLLGFAAMRVLARRRRSRPRSD